MCPADAVELKVEDVIAAHLVAYSKIPRSYDLGSYFDLCEKACQDIRILARIHQSQGKETMWLSADKLKYIYQYLPKNEAVKRNKGGFKIIASEFKKNDRIIDENGESGFIASEAYLDACGRERIDVANGSYDAQIASKFLKDIKKYPQFIPGQFKKGDRVLIKGCEHIQYCNQYGIVRSDCWLNERSEECVDLGLEHGVLVTFRTIGLELVGREKKDEPKFKNGMRVVHKPSKKHGKLSCDVYLQPGQGSQKYVNVMFDNSDDHYHVYLVDDLEIEENPFKNKTNPRIPYGSKVRLKNTLNRGGTVIVQNIFLYGEYHSVVDWGKDLYSYPLTVVCNNDLEIVSPSDGKKIWFE